MERAESSAGFRNVLVGIDGGAHARGAIALASRLMEPGGRLTLAHVRAHAFSPGADLSFTALGQDESERLLERERDAMGVSADLVSVASVSGGRGLHELAEARGCDLLAVGSSSSGPVGHVLLGDHTRSSLNGAPCAVAISPHGYEEPQKPFGVIGVGYDGSPESKAALALGRSLAARAGAVLEAMSVEDRSGGAAAALSEINIAGQASDLLARRRAPAYTPPPDTDSEDPEARTRWVEGTVVRVVSGDAGEELAAFSEGLDLLIVGSRGYGPLRRVMFGSTSQHLARTARCPLLVVPRGAHATP